MEKNAEKPELLTEANVSLHHKEIGESILLITKDIYFTIMHLADTFNLSGHLTSYEFLGI